jgi:2-hydroxyglutaryl-CoA dehydratase, D-component
VIVGTIGEAVPVEILTAADAEVLPIVGVPGEPTPLADRFVEPMVGARARSQLQRVLDGSYGRPDLIVLSREHDALLRLYHTLREIRRIDPDLAVPPAAILDLLHTGTPAASAWNRARVRELRDRVGVDDAALREGIRRSNAARRAAHAARRTSGHGRRVFVAGSAHADTRLAAAVEAAGGVLVEAPPVLTDETGDAVDAVARRLEHPRIAGALGSSRAHAVATVDAARAAGAEVVVAFFLEGDDAVRWELPELREAVAGAGLPLVVLDRQPYDLHGLVLDV